MDKLTAELFISANKGIDIEVELADGTRVEGEALSINSKGVNIKVDGKTRSFGLARVADLHRVGTEDSTDEGDTDEDIYAALGDGMTTAELAAHLSDALNTDLTPKELRVHLRALGLGVGKGRKYSLTATEFRMVRDLIKADA
jgi:hypothetical protein